MPDVGAEEEHVKVSSEIRTQKPIMSCRVCSIPAQKRSSFRPVNSTHPAEHAAFCLVERSRLMPRRCLWSVIMTLSCHYHSDTRNKACFLQKARQIFTKIIQNYMKRAKFIWFHLLYLLTQISHLPKTINIQINNAIIVITHGQWRELVFYGYSGSSGIATSYHIATLGYCYKSQSQSQEKNGRSWIAVENTKPFPLNFSKISMSGNPFLEC